MRSIKARNSTGAVDKIMHAIQVGDLSVLDADDLHYYNMLSSADDLLRDYRNHGKGVRHIARMLMVKYSVSEVTAYKLINEAKYVWRSVNIVDKDHWRPILLDMQMGLHKLMMANPTKNFKNLNASIANMIKLVGLDQKEAEQIPIEKLGNNKYVMIFNINGEMKELPFSSIMNMKPDEKEKLLDLIATQADSVSFDEIMPENADTQTDTDDTFAPGV